MGGKKVYAVRKGHQTGLFETWAECEAATKGYKGAQFKSFSTRDEAVAWLSQGGVTAAAAATHAPAASAQQQQYGSGKFYAVARGRSTGIFQGSWSMVKQYVEGYPSALFKAFDSRQDAEQYMRQHANSTDWQETSPAKRQRRSSSSSKGAADMPQPPPAFIPGMAPPAAAGPPPPPPAAVVPVVPVVPAAAAGGGVGSRVPQVSIFFDGGSRGNPGRAGYGYAVFDRTTNDKLRMGCRPLPFGSTNNEAEYSGMIAGMRYALEVLGARHLVVRGDSELVVKQMKGQYRVNGERLLPLYREAKQLEERCDSFEIEHIYREANSLADQLSNLSMDTDLVVDQVARSAAGPGGSARSRRAVVMQLATAAQLDQDQTLVAALCSAPSFLAAAADTLSRLWDNLPVEEVLAQLQARGWDESIGGPPEPEPEAAAAGGSGGFAGGAGVVAAAAAAGAGTGRAAGRAARGQQAVAVAAVSLGPGWGQEIRRQEALMQQQQQQQGQQQRGSGGSSGAGGSGMGLLPHVRRLEQQRRQGGQAVLGTTNSSTGGGGSGGSNSRRHQQKLMQQQRCHCSGGGCLGCVGGLSKRAAHHGSPAVQLSMAAAAAAAGSAADTAWAAASSSICRRRPAASLASAASAGFGPLGSRGSTSRGAALRVLQRAAPPAVRVAGLAIAGAAAAARMASSRNRPGVGVRGRHGGPLFAA